MARLEGKIALITGGNSGLGEAAARRFVEEGARVVLTGRDESKGKKVVEAIGGGAVFLEQDVRDEQRWKEVVAETVERFGGVHILMNNAGLIRAAPLESCELEEFRMQQQIMVEGTFLGCKHMVGPISRSGGGSIINVSSIGATKAGANMVAYGAAKAAVLAVTRSVAIYCQEHNYRIHVNSIVPGGFTTPMTDAEIAKMDPNDPLLAQVRAMGMGDPVDFAHLALFLASDESRHITGSAMVIDNGETAH